jgi:UDP-glucuronate 4-epimerase
LDEVVVFPSEGDALPRLTHLPLQPGDVQRTYADVTRARELLGYDPTTPVEAGIPRFVAWMKEEFERAVVRA